MYNKEKFDEEAEQEGQALRKQGRSKQWQYKRLQTSNHNTEKFNKLFKD